MIGSGTTVIQEEVVRMIDIEMILTTTDGIIMVTEEAMTPIGGMNVIPTTMTATAEGQKTIMIGHLTAGIITIESALIKTAGV